MAKLKLDENGSPNKGDWVEPEEEFTLRFTRNSPDGPTDCEIYNVTDLRLPEGLKIVKTDD